MSVLVALASLVLVVLATGESTPVDSGGLTGIPGLTFVVASLTFATTGSLIASRVSGNAIGWIFCLAGLLVGVGLLCNAYADYALFVSPGSLPGGEGAASLSNVLLTPCIGVLGVTLLLFPNGRLLSRRWMPALALAVLGGLALSTGYALRAGKLDPPFDMFVNPFGTGDPGAMDGLAGLGWMTTAASVAAGGAAILVRRRRSRGVERQQLKWIALAAALVGIEIVANLFSYLLNVQGVDGLRQVALGLTLAAFPFAAGMAILRYRLYEIDVVINRTLVYGALTATLAVAYLGSVLLLQLLLRPLTEDSNLAIAVSTLAVAALFRPARARIQSAVDRRFYRRKYDAARTLERFGSRLRDEVELDALSAELRGVVADTMQPAHVSLWLREGSR